LEGSNASGNAAYAVIIHLVLKYLFDIVILIATCVLTWQCMHYGAWLGPWAVLFYVRLVNCSYSIC